MENYLTMIKDPKRKSSQSPAPAPNNQSRTSSPFPNQGVSPSPAPTYINNLDRLKSVDLKGWGNQPQDPSPVRNSRVSYEPINSYDPIRRDTSLRANRFSAPSNGAIGGQGLANQSMYGDVQQQSQNLIGAYRPTRVDPIVAGRDPVPRERDGSRRSSVVGGEQDTSPHRNMFGSGNGQTLVQNRPSQIGSTLSSNTGLYGSTQDSVTKRTSLVTNPTSAQFGHRDVSPTFGRTTGLVGKEKIVKKGNKKKRWDIPIIILGTMVVVLAVVAVKVMFFNDHVVFCNTDGNKSAPGCRPCPDHGICKGGKLDGCKNKYKKYKNECVEDYETAARFGQYRKYINDRLAYAKGENLCSPGSYKEKFTLDDIRREVQARYKDSKLNNAFDFELEWKDYFEEEEGLRKHNSPDDGEIYVTSDEASPSLSCKFKLLWREGKLAGVWLGLFVATVVLLVKSIRNHLIYSKLGKEMYEDVKEYLTHFKNVSVKNLKKEFEHKYPGKNFEKIWSYVESYRKQEARIYQYFDIYQGVNQEFWLRTR